jgi:hypothetical protein
MSKSITPVEEFYEVYWNDDIDDDMDATDLKEWNELENERKQCYNNNFKEFLECSNEFQYIMSIQILKDYIEDNGEIIPQDGIMIVGENYDRNGNLRYPNRLNGTEEEINNYLEDSFSLLVDAEYAERFAFKLLEAVNIIRDRHKKIKTEENQNDESKPSNN